MTDVARLAGVSQMTVSRVVNRQTNVQPETRERVEKAIAELGYVPNIAARNLAGRRARRIALLHSNPSSAYLSDLLVGCIEGVATDDSQLLVESWTSGDTPERVIARIKAHRADAIVLPPPLCDNAELLAALHEASLPFAQIASGSADPAAICVSIDDEAAAAAITAYLIEQGHRRIGFIAGDPNQTAAGLRQSGYRKALEQAGIAFDPALVVQGSFTYRSGLDAADQLLGLGQPPTAIFAANDDMAAGALGIAHHRQLRVPEDLSIAGFDDSAIARTVWPHLTTIRQSISKMAQIATSTLVETPAKQAVSKQVVLPFELVVRESTGHPPAHD